MPLRIQLLEKPKAFFCPCCGGTPKSFLPIPKEYVRECEARGVEHPLDKWETLNLESYLCPLCGATDRERLQVEYLSGWVKPGMKVLEIAPGRPVRNWLQNAPGVAYRCCDLERSDVDDRVDITDMPNYPTGFFDLVICSHVLEHVPDDRKAMREIRRVIAPHGRGLFLVPISNATERTDEDPTVSDEKEQWRRFGQGDHVRIYNRNGFVERLKESGFHVGLYFSYSAAELGLEQSNCLYIGSLD